MDVDKKNFVTSDNTGGYYVCECENCGHVFSSENANGGAPLADSGDYDDIRCPECDYVSPSDCENPNLVWNVQQAKINLLEAENARLQSIIDAANAQEPDGFIVGSSLYSDATIAAIFESDVSGGYLVYARPIPAQQSPAVAVPSTLCKQLEIVSRRLEETGLSVMKNTVDFAITVLSSPSAPNEPAVAVPEWVNCGDRLPKKEDADIAGNVTCRWSNGEIVAIQWADVEVGDDEWLCANTAKSPRITEQDAQARTVAQCLEMIRDLSSVIRSQVNCGKLKDDDKYIVFGGSRGEISNLLEWADAILSENENADVRQLVLNDESVGG